MKFNEDFYKFSDMFMSKQSEENKKVINEDILSVLPIFAEEDGELILDDDNCNTCKLNSQVAYGIADYYIGLGNKLKEIEEETGEFPKFEYSPINYNYAYLEIRDLLNDINNINDMSQNAVNAFKAAIADLFEPKKVASK
jgi:hypothetical protein